MDRIENMVDNMHFIPEKDFTDSECFLKEISDNAKTKARSTLVLEQLYSKRAREYDEIALKIGKEAVRYNCARFLRTLRRSVHRQKLRFQ